ncbi:MAG TPA: hypothetical protein VFM51_04240 [Solirubrobacterales bacterium]|nr:hypothetical protein [Solirubrobacterales bacterium]
MGSADSLRGVIKFSIGLLCSAAFVLILLILSGSRIDETSARALGTAVALAFLSLTGAAGSRLTMRQSQFSLFGYVTVLISGLAFLVITAAIWSGDDGWEEAFCFLIVAFACGHTSILLASSDERGDSQVRTTQYGTVISLWLLAVLAVAEILENGHQIDERLMGVVAVLYVLGTVVLQLLRRMAPQSQSSERLQTDHVCFVWPGTIESAVSHLSTRGVQVIEGPMVRTGAQGSGVSVYYRDPDGGLIELISYG